MPPNTDRLMSRVIGLPITTVSGSVVKPPGTTKATDASGRVFDSTPKTPSRFSELVSVPLARCLLTVFAWPPKLPPMNEVGSMIRPLIPADASEMSRASLVNECKADVAREPLRPKLIDALIVDPAGAGPEKVTSGSRNSALPEPPVNRSIAWMPGLLIEPRLP